jgi:hypothetical protein
MVSEPRLSRAAYAYVVAAKRVANRQATFLANSPLKSRFLGQRSRECELMQTVPVNRRGYIKNYRCRAAFPVGNSVQQFDGARTHNLFPFPNAFGLLETNAGQKLIDLTRPCLHSPEG